MGLTPDQVKGRIKNIAAKNSADPRVLLRIYMMERFLERVASSQYADNFVIKGGILVTSLVGVAMRSTMDIDTSIRNFDLTENEALRIVGEIMAVELSDGVSFEIKEVSRIMDDMEYPGIRLSLNATMGAMVTPIKIDISTGDVVTPREIEYEYPLLLEDRSIRLWTYNLETVLAEKLQTILARGLLNTRMRDFYDIHTLLMRYGETMDENGFRMAFEATCRKRNSDGIKTDGKHILQVLSEDEGMKKRWEAYAVRYAYANGITFETVIASAERLLEIT